MWLHWRLFLIGIQLLGRQRRDLILENLVLRQQLARVVGAPPFDATTT